MHNAEKITTWAALLLVAVSAGLALAEEASPEGVVRLELAGLQQSEGKVYVAVYDSAEDWLGDTVVADRAVDIQQALEGEYVVTDIPLPPGEYALSLFFDRNGNGKMDTNFMGIPKEPVAMSNNAKMKFGPPKYKDAKFTIELEPVTQRIKFKAH